MGGTIQPYYVDPLCKLIYSIDKRPLVQPDERGFYAKYPENSSARMIRQLEKTFPSIISDKIMIFDCDASEIDNDEIIEKPNICFIDGEHTNAAVYSDFKFCLEVCQPNAIIAFHDADIIFKGIQRIKDYLIKNSIGFKGIMLGGCVYAILLNEAVKTYSDKLKPFCKSESDYFKKSRNFLFKERLKNSIRRRIPLIYSGMKLAKKIVISPRNKS